MTSSSEEFPYQTHVEKAPIGIFEVNQRGEYVEVNESACELVGYSQDELLEMSITDLIPEDDRKTLSKFADLKEKGHMRYEVQLCHRDGHAVDAILEAVEIEEGRLVAYVQDISERKKHERELERMNDLFEQAQEIADLGAWETDLRNDEGWWTEQVNQIYELPNGYEPEPGEGIEYYHPEDQPVIREAFDRAKEAGEPYDLELRVVAGEETKWVRTRGKPEFEDGDLVRVRGTIQDITKRKEREAELQRERDRLDMFASVVSHDLRNPLSVAQGRTALLEEACESEHLDYLQTALERMEEIIDDTLILARNGERVGEMESVNIASQVGNCWGMVGTSEATLEIEDDLTIRADPDRVRHICENLLRNAIEHGGDDVTVWVGQADENTVYIEDNGPGIPVDQRDAVFEPGHSSKPDGTGFGLAIVQRLAEAHGWDLTLTDSESGGARFEFSGVEIQ